MCALARHDRVVSMHIALVEMRHEMGVEGVGVDDAVRRVERQHDALEAVGAKVAQSGRVLLFDVVDGVRVERGAEAASVTAVRHLAVCVRLVEMGSELGYARVLDLAYAALVLVELVHVNLWKQW